VRTPVDAATVGDGEPPSSHEGVGEQIAGKVEAVSDSSPRWLSTAEAAKRLGITPRTLYRFIDGGQLPAYRLGRVIRLQEQEVDAFIQTCRIEPGSLEHLYPEAVPADAAATE
jgi:excisionase family DNA binding protein